MPRPPRKVKVDVWVTKLWVTKLCVKDGGVGQGGRGGGGGGTEAGRRWDGGGTEAGRDTESKTRTHIKMRGKRPSGVLVEFSAFYKHSQITALRKLMPQRLLNKQW